MDQADTIITLYNPNLEALKGILLRVPSSYCVVKIEGVGASETFCSKDVVVIDRESDFEKIINEGKID